ncbi:MAG: hypothetical protein Q8K46_03580 [Deltaproteobacteria bacterium]|nr:hypothetical protein [Deltaproteobacteria bacterium]
MDTNEKCGVDSTGKDLKELRDELWVVVPFFLAALGFFLGSFTFKQGAGEVPMVVGFITLVMAGLRLYHIIRPQSKIGEFNEAGLAGEFDHIKEEIEEETSKGHHEELKGKVVTFIDERKAFIGAIGCFLAFILCGYIVGSLLVIVGASYYYGYKEKLPIAIVMVSVFLIVYVLLYKLLEAPGDFGLLLDPILRSLDLI